jgi:DNA-binding response OmpR family regulator
MTAHASEASTAMTTWERHRSAASSPSHLVGLPARSGKDYVDRAAALGVDLTSPVEAAGIAVDLMTYTATVDGTAVLLPPRQVEILALFVGQPGRVWSRDELHWACWGHSGTGRRIDVQLSRLRSSAGRDLFRTVRHRGWALAI